MKKFTLILLCSFSFYIQASSTLPAQRTRNCIILNDTYENPLKNYGCFFWDKRGHLTMTYEFATALLENNTPILTTQSLWCTLRWFAQLWHDFATMTPEQLMIKYQPLSGQSKALFQEKINQYQPAIQAITQMYEASNQIINTNRHASSYSIEQKIKELYSNSKIKTSNLFCSSTDASHLTCDQLESISKNKNVRDIFFLYLYFRNIEWSNWNCNQINDYYLLFSPKSWQFRTTSSWAQLFTGNYDDNVVLAGLKGMKSPGFNPLQEVALMSREKIQQFRLLPDSLGAYLLDALSKTFMTKTNIKRAAPGKKETQRLAPWLLPFWNIYLGGHGSPNNITSGLNITGTNSDFNKVLLFFKNMAQTSFLTYSSCYPAGSKLQKTFGFTSPASSNILAELPYMIMALGVTLAPTTISTPLIQLPPFLDRTSLHQFIFIPPNKAYGKFFPTRQFVSFTQFFYAIGQQNYKQANHAIGHMLNYDGSLNYDMTYNIAMIKAPNTEWLKPINFKKETIEIHQIAAATKTKPIATHPLPSTPYSQENTTKALLIFANYILQPIVINRAMPQFIPMSLFSQEYYVEEIKAIHHKLTEFIEACFAVKGSKEEFTYYINKLTTKKPGTTYSAILYNRKNAFGQYFPEILYIQKTAAGEVVKHYKIHIDGKIAFTSMHEETSENVKRKILDGKIRAQQPALKIISLKEKFNPQASMPEKVRRSHEAFKQKSKTTAATDILMRYNQTLQLVI